MRFEPTSPWGGRGEELTTKPTLFKYFDLVYINGLFM